MNKGLLNSTINDEIYTPKHAVKPLVDYIPSESVVWCPFDTENSYFVKLLKEKNCDVRHSHLDEGKDFFLTWVEDDVDYIISNPPFSLKDRVLERLDLFGKPFAMLLPLTSLQGVERFKYLSRGIEIMLFDKRINYTSKSGNWFASIYVCRNVLPDKIIFKRLLDDEGDNNEKI